ncbi:MAG: zinc-binding dehydrogenase, partial [Actinomycetia bacterium]|nr:zinc-binding dehydrogenase [Actinomycetes bacterium]
YAEVSVADAAITFAIDSPAARLGSALAVAGVPNTTTALIVLERVAHMQQGERVLVHGAAGGLASMVGQVARALGAGQVIGSVRSDDAASVARRYGYATIVDGRRLIASLEEHDVDSVDVVVDPVGGELRAQSMGLLAPLGRLVAVGNASGADDVTIGANDAWLTNRAVLGLNIGGLLMAHPDFADASARRAIQLLSAGDVTIDHATLPLDEAVQAHRRLEAGGLTSRILLAP